MINWFLFDLGNTLIKLAYERVLENVCRDAMVTRDELVDRASDLFAWLASGKLNIAIDRVWPLAEAAQAHEALESRRSAGKLLLVPGP